MRNAKAKVHALIDEMPSTAVGAVLQLLTAFKPGGDLKDVDGEVKTRRSRRAKPEADEAPAKSTRRSRRSAKADDDEEKPTRSRRRRAKAEEPEEDEDEFEATIDGLEAFMDSFEGEPVEGTLKELRAGLGEYGVDPDQLVEKGTSNDEKKEEFGLFLAAMHELLDKLVGAGKDALAELADDVGADTARSAKTTAMNILVAFNSDEEDEGDEDEDEEDEDEGDDEPEAKPTRSRRSRKAKAESDEDDEDEDDGEEKGSRRSRRSKAKDDDDLGDLEDEVKSTRRRRRADV